MYRLPRPGHHRARHLNRGPNRQPGRRPARRAPRLLAGLTALALLLLPVAGCGPERGSPDLGEGHPDRSGYAVVAGPDDGTAELTKGEHLLLQLDAHPSVGYEWEVIDPATVLTTEHEWTVSEGEPGESGHPVTLYRAYRAEAGGDAEIKLRYTFRGDTERTTTLHVTVR